MKHPIFLPSLVLSKTQTWFRLIGAIAVAIAAIGAALYWLTPAPVALSSPQAADLDVYKVGPDKWPVLTPLVHTIFVTNNTNTTLNNVILTDTWTLFQFNGYTVSGNISVISTTVVTPTFAIFRLAPLAPGAVGQIQTVMTIPTTYQPAWNIPDINIAGNSVVIGTSSPVNSTGNSNVNTIVAGPVLKLSQFMSPNPVRPGRQITIEYTLENLTRSDSIDATNVVVSNVVPANTAFMSALPANLATYFPTTNTVHWNLGTVPVSTSVKFTLTARVFPTVSLQSLREILNPDFRCSIKADQPLKPTNCANTSGADVDDVFEKAVEVQTPPPQVDDLIRRTFANRVITYTFFAYNPFTTTVSLRVTDTLPRFQDSPTQTFKYLGTVGANQPTFVTATADSQVVWDTPPIGPWGVYSFTFQAFIPPTIPLPANVFWYEYVNRQSGSYSNTVLAATDFGNRQIEDRGRFIHVYPQIRTVKTVNPTSQIIGKPVTYTLTLFNDGLNTIANAIITDVLPYDGLTCAFTWSNLVNGQPPDSTSGNNNSIIQWNNVTIPGNGSWSVVFQAIANGNPNRDCFNKVKGFSAETPIVEWTNLAPVHLLQPFVFTKNAQPNTAIIGNIINYTVYITNTGTDDAVLTKFLDTLPLGFTNNGLPTYTVDIPSGFTLQANSQNSFQTTFPVFVGNYPPRCDALPADIFQSDGSLNWTISSPPILQGIYFNPGSIAPVRVIPQLQILKMFDWPGTFANSVMTYTVVISNNTTTPYSNLRLTDTLPNNFNFGGMLSGPNPTTQSGRDVIWTNLSVGSNGQTTLIFTSTVPNTVGDFDNVVKATSDTDPMVCVPRFVRGVRVRNPLIEIEKISLPADTLPLGRFEYRFIIFNRGPFTVTIGRFTDTLPNFGSPFRFDSLINQPEPNPPLSTDPMVWQNLVIPPFDERLELKFYARAGTQIGTFFNHLIQPGVPANGSGQFTGTPPAGWTLTTIPNFLGAPINVKPGVGLDKVVGPANTTNNSTIVYTITLVNQSPNTINGTIITDTLPNGFTFDSMIAGPAPSGTPQKPEWNLGSVFVGDGVKKVLVFRVKIDVSVTSGIYYNQVAATAYGVNPNDIVLIPPTGDTAPVNVNSNITPQVDLQISKSDNTFLLQAGQLVTYTIRYTNAGNVLAANIVLTETLPAGMTSADGNWSGSGNTFTRNVGQLAAGASGSTTFVAQVNANVTSNTLMTNTIQIGYAGVDVNPVNNIATDIDFISAANIALYVDDGVGIVDANQILTYTYVVRNVGGVSASNVLISTTLSPLLNVVTSAGWSTSGGAYQQTLASVAPGAAISLTFVAQVKNTVSNGNQIVIPASVSSPSDDTPGNNSFTEIDFVQVGKAGPDIRILGASLPTAYLGSPATMVVTLTNVGTQASPTWFFLDAYINRVPINRLDLGNTYISVASADYASRVLRVTSMAPNEVRQINLPITFNALGAQQVYLQADTCDISDIGPGRNCTDQSYARIIEVNEANNIFGPIAVNVQPAATYLPLIAR